MWGTGWGDWILGFLMMVLFWGGLVVLAVLALRGWDANRRPGGKPPDHPDARAILEERFAKARSQRTSSRSDAECWTTPPAETHGEQSKAACARRAAFVFQSMGGIACSSRIVRTFIAPSHGASTVRLKDEEGGRS